MSLPDRDGFTPVVYVSRSDYIYCAKCAEERQTGKGEVMKPIHLGDSEKETCCDCSVVVENRS